MNTIKWYNIMNKAGMKSMSMFCDEESVRTRLASNASAKIDRANEYCEYIMKNS